MKCQKDANGTFSVPSKKVRFFFLTDYGEKITGIGVLFLSLDKKTPVTMILSELSSPEGIKDLSHWSH